MTGASQEKITTNNFLKYMYKIIDKVPLRGKYRGKSSSIPASSTKVLYIRKLYLNTISPTTIFTFSIIIFFFTSNLITKKVSKGFRLKRYTETRFYKQNTSSIPRYGRRSIREMILFSTETDLKTNTTKQRKFKCFAF